MFGWNPAAPVPAAEAAVAIPGAEAVVERAAAAGEAGGAAPEAVAVAAEAEVAGSAAAPIPARLISYVCRREPFVCEQLPARRRASHWRYYSFAEALSVFVFQEKRQSIQLTLTFRVRFSSAFIDSVRDSFSIWQVVRETNKRIEASIRIEPRSL